MKKKITLIALLALLASNGLSYADTISSSNADPNVAPVKVAIVSDLLKGAVKSGVYSLGTMLLNKYANSTNYIPIVMPTTTNTSILPTQTTTPTTETNMPPDQPEPMIPIT